MSDEGRQKGCAVVQFPLCVDRDTGPVLDKKLKLGCMIYNTTLRLELNKYQSLIKTKVWRSNQDVIAQEYQKLESAGDRKKRKQSGELQKALSARNDMLNECGLTKFGVRKDAIQASKPYVKNISSNMAGISIGEPLWMALSALIYGNGKKVYFKSIRDFNRLESDNKSGMRLLQDEKGYYLFFANQQAKTKKLKVYLKGTDRTDYDKNMLSRPIRRVALIRKKINGTYRYYCHVTVEGVPYVKTDKNGNRLHPVGKGRVGVTVYRGMVYAVGKTDVKIWNLCPGLNVYQQQRDELVREMEEIRRRLNPDNYNEDGTIRKQPEKGRLHWNVNCAYQNLLRQKNRLEWKEMENRRLLKNKIVYELLKMGDSFVTYDTSYITKKPDYDADNPLPLSQYREKAQRRRDIQEAAPAELMVRLNRKLVSEGKEPAAEIRVPKELWWYHHEKDRSDQEYYRGHHVNVCGHMIPEFLYRAFLVLYYDTEGKRYDRAGCMRHVKKFIEMAEEIG